MSRGHKRGSGERSNIYSENKFSNWSRFNPYYQEIDSIPRWTEADLFIEIPSGKRIAVVAQELHPAFIMPVTAEDIRQMLLKVPSEFLEGLETIYLLGGTSKQDKVAFGNLFLYGCYWYCKIALAAFPKRVLTQYYSKLPSPDIMHEYERIGATWTSDRDGWVFEFSPETLKAFYLYDVLLHEVGHHVDRRNMYRKSTNDCEHYARWFTTFCRQNLVHK